MIISKIKDRIASANRILITGHTSPDGDALGSSLGLYGMLKKMGIEAKVVLKERPSDELSFLPWFDSIIIDDEFYVKEEDLIIVLDCGNTERINLNFDLQQHKNNVINIDHHKSNEEYGIINWVDTKSAAVGEMIYKIIMEIGVELDSKIAECLYTSILTDTGAFKYSNTTETTHKIAGVMVSKGIDFTSIYEKIYDTLTYKQILMQMLLIESMELHFDGKLCIMEIKKDDLERIGALDEDTGHLVNIGMQIDTVEVGLLLKEKEGITKGSLRSKKYIDVCEVANLFGGGGHVRASGFGSETGKEEIKDKIISHLEGII